MTHKVSLPKFTMSKQTTFQDAEQIPDPEDSGYVFEGHESEADWPEDAIGMKEERVFDRKNGKNIVRVIKTYKMLDG